MKFIRELFKIAVSFGISYILFYNITSDFISYFFQGSFRFEQILYILIYIVQSILIYCFIQLFIKGEINRNQIRIIWALYICVMLILLFGRRYLGSVINLNPFDILDLNFYSFFQNLFNFLLFIPIGFLFKNRNSKRQVIVKAILIVLLIETIQLISMRGIFDIVDLILDSSGIYVGFIVSSHIPDNLKIEIL